MAGVGIEGWHERIADARESMPSKPSQPEFGRLLGEVKQGKVSTWETGKVEPSLDEFQRIAEVTGKPFLWLICGHECASAELTDALDREIVRRVVYEMMRQIGPRIAHIPAQRIANNVVSLADLAADVSTDDIARLVEKNLRK